jgi:hypothetical protein
MPIVQLLLHRGARLGGTGEQWSADIFHLARRHRDLNMFCQLLDQFEASNHEVPFVQIFEDSVNANFEAGALELLYRRYLIRGGQLDKEVHKRCCILAAQKKLKKLLGLLLMHRPYILLRR